MRRRPTRRWGSWCRLFFWRSLESSSSSGLRPRTLVALISASKLRIPGSPDRLLPRLQQLQLQRCVGAAYLINQTSASAEVSSSAVRSARHQNPHRHSRGHHSDSTNRRTNSVSMSENVVTQQGSGSVVPDAVREKCEQLLSTHGFTRGTLQTLLEDIEVACDSVKQLRCVSCTCSHPLAPLAKD